MKFVGGIRGEYLVDFDGVKKRKRENEGKWMRNKSWMIGGRRRGRGRGRQRRGEVILFFSFLF